MAEYAIFQSSGVQTAEQSRLGLSGLLPSIGSLQSRSGLLGGGGVCTLNSGMSINVSAFRAHIQGTSGATQGSYLAVLSAAKTLTFDDGAVADRTDLVVARIYHDSYDSSGFTKFSVEIVKGTPGGGVPATPVNAIKLAEKVITSTMSAGTGGLGTVPTDKRPPRLVAAGGCVPVVNTADRDTLDVYDGLMVHRLDNHTTEQRVNGAWRRVSGSEYNANGGPLATANTTYATLALPAGRWSLIAKGNWEWSIGSLGETATAELCQDGTVIDSTAHTYPLLNGGTSFCLAGVVDLAAAATLIVRVRTSGLDGSQLASQVRLLAIPG